MCFRAQQAETKRRQRKAIKDKIIITRQITNHDRSTYYNILCPNCKDEKIDKYCPKCKTNYNISVKETYKKRKLGLCDQNCKDKCCANKKKQKLQAKCGESCKKKCCIIKHLSNPSFPKQSNQQNSTELTLPGSSNDNRSNYVKGPQGMSLASNTAAASAGNAAAAAAAAATSLENDSM